MTITKLTGMKKQTRTRWLAHLSRSSDFFMALVIVLVLMSNQQGFLPGLAIGSVVGVHLVRGATKWLAYVRKRKT